MVKVRAVAKARPKVKAQKNPKSATTRTQPMPKSVVGQNRSEGLRQFRLAGKPTRQQFILVFGKRGHLMTWTERAKAGVPAKKFQAALAAKLAEKAGSRPVAAKPARTTT